MCAGSLELLQGDGGGGHEGNFCFSPFCRRGIAPRIDHLFEFLVLVSCGGARLIQLVDWGTRGKRRNGRILKRTNGKSRGMGLGVLMFCSFSGSGKGHRLRGWVLFGGNLNCNGHRGFFGF